MATNWQIGDRIQNRWEIHKILKGGMGIVYLVYDHEHHEVYAAKTFQDEVFTSSPLAADRFRQEALSWINLDLHQNITQARFVENIAGKPFLFLEYVSGGDLSRWIGTPRLTQDKQRTVLFAIQFCDGMSHVLSKGIKAHRDIKPQNCLITEDAILKVTDFGLAKVFGGEELTDEEKSNVAVLDLGLTRTGTTAGTPTHMAPEQFDDVKTVDVRADIYSFGVMFYQMLTGHLPFEARSWQDLERLHKTEKPREFTAQPSALREIIETSLAKEPSNRFANFEAVRMNLAQVYEVLTGESVPPMLVGPKLDAVSWNNKGLSLDSLGRKEEALASFDVAIALEPRYEPARYNKGITLDALGQSEQAVACYTQALEINPESERAWANMGSALVDIEEIEEGLACFDQAIQINPHLGEAWHNKGFVLAKMGQAEYALACYDRALELDPHDGSTWTNKGNVLRSLRRIEEAIACHERAIELESRDDKAWANRGNTLVDSGRTTEALDSYARSVELNPGNETTWYNRGVVMLELERFSEAAVCLQQAHRLGHPRALQALELCNRKSGK